MSRVDPAECVRAVSIIHCLFEDAAAKSGRAVDELQTRILEALEDAEPIAENFLVRSSYFKPCPL